MDRSDYERFLSLLLLANNKVQLHISSDFHRFDMRNALAAPPTDPLVSIVAYCLMPNHFHILAFEKTEGGISKFMQKLSTAYTMYFNNRRERSGSLFQGRFKARHADNDRYLRYLIAYIHLNPVKLVEPKWKEKGLRDISGTERFLETYAYSSFPEFTGKRRPLGSILDKTVLPDYFPRISDFKNELKEWMSYRT